MLTRPRRRVSLQTVLAWLFANPMLPPADVPPLRGRFNRLGEPRDLLALNTWATRNKLSVQLGRW